MVCAHSDVARAQLRLLNAGAQLIDTGNQRAALEHAIAILLGRVPSAFSLGVAGDVRPHVAAGHRGGTFRLLRRRPDDKPPPNGSLAAANAQIGVTRRRHIRRSRYPARLGSAAPRWQICCRLNRFWSVGPALALSLFDGGARDAAGAQAVAAYDHRWRLTGKRC